jgi:hypothetical protein
MNRSLLKNLGDNLRLGLLLVALGASATCILGKVSLRSMMANQDKLSRQRVNLGARPQSNPLRSYNRLPFAFEPNLGQFPEAIRFVARSAGGAVLFTDAGAVFRLVDHAKSSAFELRFEASTPSAPVGLERRPGIVNYFIGRDARAWRTRVPTYGKISYPSLYPGIDLVYYGDRQRLEYDLVVRPGADPSVVRVSLQGASDLRIDAHGHARFRVGDREVIQRRPDVYQLVANEKKPVGASYVQLSNHLLALRLAPYDGTKPLVIDPVLVYSTFLGGDMFDSAEAVAVDGSGSAYVVGQTQSSNFPTTQPYQPSFGGAADAFVTKLSPDGSEFIYSTFLGGNNVEAGFGIAVDSQGNAYVTGITFSADFPVVNALQPTYAGRGDVFVVKLTADGSVLVFSTFLGGSDSETGHSLAVDTDGNVYVTGVTSSLDFPIANPIQSTYGGGASDAFVAKIASDGSSLVYSTYLGGEADDPPFDISVDGLANAHVIGRTSSTDFPTANALQATHRGGEFDVFITKLNADGSAFVYSTFLGGTGYDSGIGIAADQSGNAYLTGYTASFDFTTVNPLQPALAGGGFNAFVAKLVPDGSRLEYSTFLGGGGDFGFGIAIDDSGAAYVTGQTYSPNFPTVLSLQSYAGAGDAFVAKLTANGSALEYSTFLGGNDFDWGHGIAVDSDHNAYVVGQTASTDFPTFNAVQDTYAGGSRDGYISKIIP